MFYQGVPIDHWINIPSPVDQSSYEVEYNTTWTAAIDIAHFSILIIELFNNDPDVVPEQEHLIILDIKSAICMANNNKESKHTRHISRRINFIRNGEEFNFLKTVWCKGDLKLADIVTKKVRED